jgi:ABC-type spermidine/putrescine transport system permease subunit II
VIGRMLLRLYAYLMTGVFFLPIAVTVPVAVTTTGYVTFPPVGFTFKWFHAAFADRILMDALGRSVTLALISSAVSVGVALLAAFAVERNAFRGKDAIEAFFTAPNMVPQIILVLGLLIFYESVGLAETLVGLFMAHVIIGLPFAFRALLATVGALDRRLEWSAEILGANRVEVLTRVILPQMKTGVYAAFMFAFMASFTNVTTALFLAPVGRRTLPVEMFHRMQVGGMSPTLAALAFVLALVGIGVFVVADRTVGIYKYLGGGGH